MRAIVVPDKAGPPSGIQCLICRRVSKPGDIILLHTIHRWGYICMHKECIKGVVEEMPLDTYENLAAKLASGGALFD